MNTKISASYSLTIDTVIPSNGFIIYGIEDYDRQMFAFAQAVSTIQGIEGKSIVITNDEDGQIVVSVARLNGEREVFKLSAGDKAIGLLNLSTGNTWGEAYQSGTIRVLKVLNRLFPIDIGGRQ